MSRRAELRGRGRRRPERGLPERDTPPEPPLRQKLGWFAALYAAGLVTITAVAYAIRWGMGMG